MEIEQQLCATIRVCRSCLTYYGATSAPIVPTPRYGRNGVVIGDQTDCPSCGRPRELFVITQMQSPADFIRAHDKGDVKLSVEALRALRAIA